MKLGPAKFITRSLSKNHSEMTVEECNSHFRKVTDEFRSIWGIKITSSLMENTLCELWRSYKKTQAGMKKHNTSLDCGVEVITNPDLFIDSRVNDVYYFDDRRKCIQNFFNIQSSGKGINELRPALIMKKSREWGSSNRKWNFLLTNWRRDQYDKEHMYWEYSGKERTLDTRLHFSEELKKSYFLPQRQYH